MQSVIEGYSWQLMILVSGYLSVVDQAANSIIMNIVIVFFSVNVGLTASSATFIGNAIGAQDVKEARSLYSAHFKLSVILMFFFSMLFYQFKS